MKKHFTKIIFAIAAILFAANTYAQQAENDFNYNIGTGFNGSVLASALQSDGKLVVGGSFTSFNGTTRNRIARLNTNGTLDATFDPGSGFTTNVTTLAIQSDGKIIAGGLFSSYNGNTAYSIVRISTTGAFDATFAPTGTGLNGYVTSVAIQSSDQKIVVGGAFTSYNGISRKYIARLKTNGTLDTFGFAPGTGFDAMVETVAINSAGYIVAAGRFSSFNGTSRIGVAQLNSNGTLDATFSPNAALGVTCYALAIQSDGKIIVGTIPYGSGVYRLNVNGSMDAAFNTGGTFGGAVLTLKIQPDGKILVGGQFSKGLRRLNTNGTNDYTVLYNGFAGSSPEVWTTAIQSDGKVIVGGTFTSYNFNARNNIARLTSCGSVKITTQPANQTVCPGSNCSYSVADSGTGLTYQWQVNPGTGFFSDLANGGIYSGVTTSKLTLTAVTNAYINYEYRCIISDASCNTTTAKATLTINTPQTITADPINRNICENANTSFYATVAGSYGGYQWQLDKGAGFANLSDGGVYSGVTTNTLTITGATFVMNNYKYRLVASICTPVTSNFATLTVNPTPVITSQPPTSQYLCNSGNVVIPVTATGTGISYQWQIYSSGWNNLANGGIYSGVTTSSLTLTGATSAASNTIYRCNISTSSCAVTSDNSYLYVYSTPNITSDPADVTRCSSSTSAVNFTVAVTAQSGITYQWQEKIGSGPFTNIKSNQYNVGSTPYSVTTADFNGDSKADLAVANGSSNNVSILLGDGAGSFATAVNFAAGSYPRSVITADFNSDGKADLAVANQNSNNVSILLGNGTGGFAAAVNYAVGSNPRNITSADFNDDGKVDLAVANEGSDNVSILTGNGSGGFVAAPIVAFPAGIHPFAVSSADFNGDGKVDLVVTQSSSGNNVSTLLGDGTGGFATIANSKNFTVGLYPYSLVTGDFNGDTKVDIATANYSGNTVSILLGNGADSFATFVDYYVGSSANSVIKADFNGDSKTDLAVSIGNSGNVSILLGNGTGGFAAALYYATGSLPQSLVTADFNGDTKADLAVANTNSNSVSILLGNGAGIPLFPSSYTGVNATTLSLPFITSAMNGNQYRCVVGSCSPPVYSNSATLYVDAPPVIKTQPLNSTVCVGMNANFSLADSGSGLITYQWQELITSGSWTNLSNNAPYSGVTSNSLDIAGVTTGMSNYRYRCILTSGTCTVATTIAVLTVRAVPTFNYDLPPRQVCSGNSTTFLLNGINNSYGDYQWQEDAFGLGIFTDLVNNATYSGVKTNYLQITNATASMNNRIYRLVAGLCTPSAYSDTAMLRVNTMPLFSSQPSNQNVCNGQYPAESAVFIVTAVGSPLSYQWQSDFGLSGNWSKWTNGGTNDTLILSPNPGYNKFKYRCIINSGVCMDTSSEALMTVYPGLNSSSVNNSVQSYNNPTFTFQGYVSVEADTAYWNFGDGTIIPFSPLGGTLTQAHTFTANGNFSVCLTARNKCDTITKCTSVQVSGVGIEDHMLNNSISIFPNPNKGAFTINNDSPFEVMIEIDNILGKKISTCLISGNASKLIDSKLTPGMYIVKISNDSGLQAEKKIVIEK